jgi:ABC-2 type transport system ATP-binding protein
VAILKRGNLLLDGPVSDVLRSEDQLEVRAADMQQLQTILQSMDGVTKIRLADNSLHLTCVPGVNPEQVNSFCSGKGIVLSHLVLKKKSLESKFMELTS